MKILIVQTIIMPSSEYIILGGFFMFKEEDWLDVVQKQIGYTFNNRDILQQAFVRRSYAKENGGADNEILEFVGDRALEIFVTKYLMKIYGYFLSETDNYDAENDYDEYYSECTEGELTDLKKRLVQGRTLANRINSFGWNEHLILGKGDLKNNIYLKDSVKEDLFEAIIGAVTIDSDWDFEKIESVIEYMLDPDIELESGDTFDYVGIVQDWYKTKYGKNPVIECYDNNSWGFIVPIGYGNSSGPYRCELSLSNLNNSINMSSRQFCGFGHSKTEARRDLCLKIYKFLEENHMLKTIRDEIENPNKEQAINQLEILARRGYFSIPSYTFKEIHDRDGNPIWSAECHIAEYSIVTNSKTSSKKEAKKNAAYKMLKYVLKEQDN